MFVTIIKNNLTFKLIRDCCKRKWKIYEVLAARKTNLITACARKIKRSARMLANARKDHSIPLGVVAAYMVLVY